MTRDLGWTSREIGVLTGTLFWTYGIGQLVNGRLSEIVGTSRFLTLSVLLSAAVNVIVGFQSSLLVMVILWGLNGFFQSMSWTPGLAALTNWWPGNKRGFATGFAHAFSGFGQAVSTLSVALAFAVLPAQGWRAAFWIPAAFPLAMLLLFVLLARPTPTSVGLPEYREDDPERAAHEEKLRALSQEKGKFYPYKFVLSNGRFWLWIAIALITGIARYGLSTWIPMYFVEKFDLDITSGLLQSLTLPVGMGIGTLVVPALTDRFCPQNRLPAVIVSAIVGAAAVGGIVTLDPRIVWQRVILLVLLFIAGFCIYAISGTSWAYATDIGGRVFSGYGYSEIIHTDFQVSAELSNYLLCVINYRPRQFLQLGKGGDVELHAFLFLFFRFFAFFFLLRLLLFLLSQFFQTVVLKVYLLFSRKTPYADEKSSREQVEAAVVDNLYSDAQKKQGGDKQNYSAYNV